MKASVYTIGIGTSICQCCKLKKMKKENNLSLIEHT